jgi:hypothetical protein
MWRRLLIAKVRKHQNVMQNAVKHLARFVDYHNNDRT